MKKEVKKEMYEEVFDPEKSAKELYERLHKQEIESWKDETNKKLKEEDSPYVVTDPIWYKVTIVLLILFIMAGIALFSYYFGWGVVNDKFKSESSFDCGDTNVTILPNVCPTAPSCPSCQACPSLSCGNITINPIIYGNSS